MSRTTLACLLAAATLLTAGCSGGNPAPAGNATAAPSGSASTAGTSVTVTDAWARAVPELGDMPMTGVFATLKNTTDKPVVITSAENSVSKVTELHEVVTKNGKPSMQQIKGGFSIEPGATRELRPGGDHIMVMKMTTPLTPGQTVKITLTTQDGQKIPFDAVAKTFTGGDEKYHSGAPSAGATESHGGMDHSGHDHSSHTPDATSTTS